MMKEAVKVRRVQRKVGSIASAAMFIAGASLVTGAAARTTLPQDVQASTTPLPKPVGNPADWFPDSAYPPEARNAGQEGRTSFSVKVDAKGRIMECDVVQSSGSILLDNTTCDLIVSNGRFAPAVDASGKPVAGVWHSAMRWQLVAASPSIEPDDQ